MTFVHADEVNAQEPGPGGDHVVVLAPKRATAEQQARASFLDSALQRRTAGAVGRRPAGSPSPPPTGRRRASPSYETFKPRGSPTYDALPSARTADAAAVTSGAAAAAVDAYTQQPERHRQHSPDSRVRGPSSRSASRSRSRSRKAKRSRQSRSRSRNRSRSRSPQRHTYRSSSRSRNGHHKRASSHHSRSRSRRRGRSRSRDKCRRRTHRSRSRSRGRGRSRDRYYDRHGRPAYSSSRSRSRTRGRSSSRGRSPGGGAPQRGVRFSSRERAEAWREQRQAQQQVRRGKQGLGFAPSAVHDAPPGATRRVSRSPSRRSGQRDPGTGAAAGSGASGKGVCVISAAASIPGYSSMTPAEQLKARMKLLMSRADQQNANAAAAAADIDADVGGAGDGSSSGGWTRFVLDRHGALDEDKQAMQQLLDQQVGQAGFGGSSTADVGGEAGAAFIMGTGRAAARRAAARTAADDAHADAIFGGGGAGAGAAGSGNGYQVGRAVQHIQQQQQQPWLGGSAADVQGGSGQVVDEAASLGLSEGVLAQQAGLSWRERALAKRQQQQQ